MSSAISATKSFISSIAAMIILTFAHTCYHKALIICNPQPHSCFTLNLYTLSRGGISMPRLSTLVCSIMVTWQNSYLYSTALPIIKYQCSSFSFSHCILSNIYDSIVSMRMLKIIFDHPLVLFHYCRNCLSIVHFLRTSSSFRVKGVDPPYLFCKLTFPQCIVYCFIGLLAYFTSFLL